MCLRSALYALAFVFATAVVFILVSFAAIFFLAERNCGASFGYYGCASPSATTPADDDVDQVARAGEDRRPYNSHGSESIHENGKRERAPR